MDAVLYIYFNSLCTYEKKNFKLKSQRVARKKKYCPEGPENAMMDAKKRDMKIR